MFQGGQFAGSRTVSASRVISIGRAPESAVVLDDPQVSARHALLYVENGKLFIADLGSTNGIFVNGNKVAQSEVTPFDELRIGECRLKVEFQPPPDAPSAPDDGPPPAERTQTGVRVSRDVTEPGRKTEEPVRRAPEVSGKHHLTPDLESTAQERQLAEPRSPFGKGGTTGEIPAPQPTAPDAPRARGKAPEPPPAARPAPSPQPTDPDAPRARSRRNQPHSVTAAEPASDETRVGRVPPPAQAPGSETVRGRLKPSEPARAEKPQERPAPQAPARPEPPAEKQAPPARADKGAGDARARGGAEPARRMEAERPAPAASRKPDLALMSPAPADYHEDLDEEEKEDLHHVPTFSILDNVVRDRMQDGVKGEAQPVLEVIRYRAGRLLDVARLEPGDSFSIFDGEKGSLRRLVKVRGDRRARIQFTKDVDGNVVIGGRAAALSAMASAEHLTNKRKGIYSADLAEGDYAQVKIPGGGYLLRFVRSPQPPPVKVRFSLTREDRAYGLAGFIGIALMFGGIVLNALLSPPELIVQDEKAEFAEVSLKDLDMQKPPEPPPPPPPAPPVEVKAPEAPPPVPEPTPKPTPVAHKTKSAPLPSPKAGPPVNVPPPPTAQDKALAALENLGPPTNAPKLSTAVSNIAAVRVPAGAPSSFAVAGAIGKLPGNEVLVSTGGRAGGRDTRAAAALLAGKNVGALQGGGGSNVRGKLEKAPLRSVATQGGSLDRNEIAKVVAAAYGAINSCYERQLMKDGSLEGKLVVDWVIDLGGGVSSTRVRSSSIHSEEVASCVTGVIRGLRFPKPTGGSVTVTYPFAFRSASF